MLIYQFPSCGFLSHHQTCPNHQRQTSFSSPLSIQTQPSPIRPSIVTIAEKNQEIGPGKGPRARYQVLSVPFVNFFYVSQNLISVMGFLFCRTQLQHRWGLQHKNAETEVSSSLISIFFFSFLDEKFHCCCMLDYKFLICKSL